MQVSGSIAQDMLLVSRQHLSQLNQTIRTQYKLLKMTFASNGLVQEQLVTLFLQWSQQNTNLNRIYDDLSENLITLADKKQHQKQIQGLARRLEDVDTIIKSMQFEKEVLEQNCLRYKNELQLAKAELTRRTAQLNKLVQEKGTLAERLKQKSDLLKGMKTKIDAYKQKCAALQQQCRILQRPKQQQIDAEQLEKELRELQNQFE